MRMGFLSQKKNEIPAQTPPLKGGVKAGTVLFSLATVVDYGGERVKIRVLGIEANKQMANRLN